MSIGPSKKEELGFKTVDKIELAVRGAGKEYFRDPSYYLFYIMLSLTVLGLFFGKTFSIHYYSILILLGLYQALKSYGDTDPRTSHIVGDEGRQHGKGARSNLQQPSSSHPTGSK